MIDSFAVMVRDSIFLKAAAILFLLSALMACLVVACVEVLNGQPINNFVQSILFAGLGAALHLLGLNQGVTLQSIKPQTPTPVTGAASTATTQKLTQTTA